MGEVKYRLDDRTIALIAKLVQVAILTGTDIVDNLRTVELIELDGVRNDGALGLVPSKECKQSLESSIDSMLFKVKEIGEGRL
mgnify:CR=1 FL=1